MKPTSPLPDDRILTFLQRALDINHAIYGLGIDVLAAYSPLLATLIPAYLTYTNTHTYLHFENWIAFASAAAVEVLGISAVHTTVAFYQYNDSLTRKTDQRAPFWLALAAAIFYIAIVLIVNTGLDWSSGTPLVNVIAAGALSLLSVIGALIIAVRAQQSLKLTGNDPATVQKYTETERELREANTALKQANKQIADLNTANQNLTTELTQLNTTNTDLNTTNQTLTTELKRLNAEYQRLNTLTEKLSVYRTIFDADRDAAERVPIAHRTFPDASQNALSQIMNIPKATLNAHWPTNGHHRTPSEQE